MLFNKYPEMPTFAPEKGRQLEVGQTLTTETGGPERVTLGSRCLAGHCLSAHSPSQQGARAGPLIGLLCQPQRASQHVPLRDRLGQNLAR